MSDHPPNSNQDDQSAVTGSWHQPQVRGEWHPPKATEQPQTGWRVPTLPTTVTETPEEEGVWHLPQPEDTVFTADDVSEVIGVEEKPADALDPIDFLADAVRTAEGGAPPSPAEPKEAPKSPEDLLTYALEYAQTEDDDEDSESFSMSELVALASLVDEQPEANVIQGASAPLITSDLPLAGEEFDDETQADLSGLSPAERALLQPTEALPQPVAIEGETTDAEAYAQQQLAALDSDTGAAPTGTTTTDPAEYARQQLAALGLGDDAIPGAVPAGAVPTQSDPGEYARQQLAALGLDDVGDSGYTPVGDRTALLDPAVQELADKFRQTEAEVRSLRIMYQRGEITRDDLQARLRQHMILDNDQVWWMMGVETDTWYKYQNNEWIAATPPALAAAKQAGPPPTVTGQIDPNEVIQGSLPYLPSQPVGTGASALEYDSAQYDTSGIQLDENNMPLPRQVPIRDPYSTVVGARAAYLDEDQSASSAPTLASTPAVSEPTVLARPVQYGDYEAVEAPYDTSGPPDYSFDEDEETPLYEDASRRQRSSLITMLALVVAVGLAVGLIAGAAVVLGALSWYNGIVAQYEPQIAALVNFEPAFQTVRILDARGDLIAELTSEEGGARTEVELKDIAPEMIHAVVSVENERFFEDPGWDLFAIVRAFIQNVTSGDIESGASTITQQIARNLVIQSTDVTAERKVHEIVVAGEVSKRYDKDFILKLYLNEVFFGNQSYGVEAAAEFYFDKKAADLNLAESALLAGLIQAPAQYDPVVNRDAAFARMRIVLDRQTQVGCLQFQHAPYQGEPFCVTRSDVFTSTGDYAPEMSVQVALVEGRPFTPRKFTVKYPHFVNLVQAQIENFFGAGEMYRRGFTITTTLIPETQQIAEDALASQLANLVNTGLDTGAVMVTDPKTGAIRAMVGSPDFNNADIAGQVNNALTYQQPGSSIKPVVYTAALEGLDRNGDGRLGTDEYLTPASILWDVPTYYQQYNYRPVNYDGRFHGPIPVRQALGNSYNVPAVKTFEFIGVDKFKDTAVRMGLNFQADAQFSLATGVGATEVRLYDMMVAYGTLANGGKRNTLYAIESVTEGQGQKVEIPPRSESQQVIQPQIAFLMQSILSDDNARAAAFGRNTVLTLPGYPTQDYVAAKTGTTDGNRDLWTLGFTRTAVVGVWLGHHQDQETIAQGGFAAAAPVWNQVMQAAVAGVQPQKFENPGNVVLGRVCNETGTLPADDCPTVRNEYYLASQPPPPADQAFVRTVEVDTWSGLIANEFCPDNKELKTFANISDSSAVDWINSTSAGQAYAQSVGIPLPIEAAPVGTCEFGTTIPTVRIIDPFDNKTVSGTISITGQVSANPEEFSRYQLEFADVNVPDTFQMIGNFSTQQQPNAGSVLGTWDTTKVVNGTYNLRLAVFATNGGFVYRTVRINVNNVAPTATPTPNLPPTVAPAQFTPIPFDTVVPAQSAPTVEIPGL